MLKLCRYTGSKKAADFTDAFVNVYKQIIEKCETQGALWLQIEEPALVQDMSKEDIALFHKIYDALLSVSDSCKILLQTYFGDVRDIYKDLITMPFAGIGLDFLEGKKTAALVEEYGYPTDKILFAGLVNGKNIWKNHYDRTLKVIRNLREKDINVVLSTSCSLLHVPYTLQHENKLVKEYLEHFAFAEEKLTELKDLGKLADCKDYTKEVEYQKNYVLFEQDRNCNNEAVKSRLA